MPLLMLLTGAVFEPVVITVRTALAVQQIRPGGLAPTYEDGNNGGHSFPNSGREFLHIKADGGNCTVTIYTPGTVDGLAIDDRTVVVEGGTEALIGPFPASVYDQDAADDDVYFDLSTVVGVTVAALRL